MKIAALLLYLGTVALASELVTAPCVADTHVYATPWTPSADPDKREDMFNFGASNWLTVKGREYFGLLQFDTTEARGLTLQRATLRFYRSSSLSSTTVSFPVPLHTLGISTISGNGPWAEGTQTGGGRALAGAANYLWARYEEQPWAYAGSDLTDVTFGLGGSLYAYVQPRDAGDGWFEIDLPLSIANALVSGDQFGLMITDEKGQAYGRHYISSRTNRFPPALILEGERLDRTPPGAVQSFKTGAEPLESTPEEARASGRTTLAPGTVVLDFGAAGDDEGQGVAARYEVRYSESPIDEQGFAASVPVPRWCLNPLAPKPDHLATANSVRDRVTAVVEDLKPGAEYSFAARATDEAGNAGPVSPIGRYRAYAREFPTLPDAPAAPSPLSSSIRRRSAGSAARVWAVPDLVKIHPQTGALLEGEEGSDHRERNAIWDSASGTVRLSGARNEFVAFQLAIESPEPLSSVQVSVGRPLFEGSVLPEVFSGSAVQLYREWFVPDDQQSPEGGPWHPDPLLTLEGPFELPAADNAVPGQTVQPVFVDIFIPHDVPPGFHSGSLMVRAGDEILGEVAVEVQVLPLTLPDRLNFVIDLNAYGSVSPGYNVRTGTPEYRRLLHAYHRMAHLHRTNLNVLGYSHSGSVEPDYSPPLEGEGADTRVSSWENWDAHFGPLVDGSAFTGLPRAGVPITNLYLNLFENWPGDLRTSYTWNSYPSPATTKDYQDLIARHGLESGPVEEGFPDLYKDRFSAVARQFAEHARERGWTGSRYQVYFNNKYFYKDPAQGGRGVSWWLLDEPNHRDDIRALSFFGGLARRWLGEFPEVPIVFRTDISYIDFIRDLLAGQIDLNCTSARFFKKNRFLMDNRDRFGREYWNYSSTNHPRDSNVAMRAWCWRVWTAGGDGLVPWNTVRGSEAWTRTTSETVFYTGSRFGKSEPFASLRLKAYRRGQQDLEYLMLLSQKEGWDREAVSRALPADLDRLKNEDFEDLRLRVAAAIE
jgi:hypothetical protein